MKKVELLAPCGSMAALKMAIACGADAVYLGGNQFGARAYAKNFTNEEIVETIKLSHLYNVKVYVTVNTLIYDHEFTEVLKFIDFLYHHDVDAIIVQDLGLLKTIRKHYPDLPLHASTQMTVHNPSGVKLLKDEGLSRVVLARENTIDEIKHINDEVGIETEVFIHGALCVCYSGQCLMSSLIGGRSGNRGRCAQPCRKRYSLMEEDNVLIKNKYLISPKDLNTIENLAEIIEAGVSSLKIEGRMKDPEYVAAVVSTYRKAIDSYYATGKIQITEKDLHELRQIFNRGFTKGFIFNATSKDFINHEKNNNAGVKCGKVVGVKGNKVTIKLDLPLHVGDGIYFNKSNLGLVVTKLSLDNDLATIEVANPVILNDEVYKTKDVMLETSVQDFELPKIPINGSIELFINQKAKLTLIDDRQNEITIESDFIVQPSINQTLDSERITAQIGKLGNTQFVLNNLDIKRDANIFVVTSALNELRRKAVDALIKLRETHHKRRPPLTYKYHEEDYRRFNEELELAVYCETYDQYRAAKDSGIKRIFVDEDIVKLVDDDAYLVKRRINHQDQALPNRKLVISDLGALYKALNHKYEVISNYNFNVVNSETINYLLFNNVSRVTLSLEMNEAAFKNLRYSDKTKLEIIVYGYQEVMITKYCLFSSINGCKHCPRNNSKHYYFIDEINEYFPIRMDKACKMHIYNSKNLILSKEVLKLKDYGYKKFRINLTCEDYQESLTVIKAYQELIMNNNINSIEEIITKYKVNNNYTRGYFNKAIM